MKKYHRIYNCFVITLIAVLSSNLQMLHAQTFDQLWKQVEQAQEKDLPQTAIKLADQIYRKGEREKNVPQMLKAYITRSSFQNNQTPDSFYVNLKDLEAWTLREKNVVNRAVLNSLIAGIYADYASDNSWELRQRTPLQLNEKELPDDIREWSGNLLAKQVIKYANESLKEFSDLQKVSTRAYSPFTIQGDASGYYHHDMYHLLVSRAVSALKQVSSFNTETDTVCKKEIEQIFRQIIDLYEKAADGDDAIILATLDWLDWQKGQNGPVFRPFAGSHDTEKDTYLHEVDQLIKTYGGRNVCAEAYMAKAIYYRGLNKNVEALAICDEAIIRYPKYSRIALLKGIRKEILLPELSMNTSKVTYPGDSLRMNINHRNLEGFTVSFYKMSGLTNAQLEEGANLSLVSLIKRKGKEVVKQHFQLLRPNDYQSTDTVFRVPTPNVPGIYALQLIPDGKGGGTSENLITLTRFKVLTLGLPNNNSEIVALDAATGYPIDNAQISIYSGKGMVVKQLTTGKDGKVSVVWNSDYRTLVATKGEDNVMTPQYGGNYRNWESGRNRVEQVKLITDRTLYRPAQTVYVKGVAYLQENDSANIAPGRKYTVVLRDVNNRELSKKEVVTNEFGSFTTDFSLPSACLNGTYMLEVMNIQGATRNIQVEEYKRPTFEITFDAPKESYQIGDSVLVKGLVKTFSGVPVQNVEINYTVTRNYNPWLMGSYIERVGNATPLKSDKRSIDSDGHFSIPVYLEGVEGLSECVFNYVIEANVTSVAGETQRASTSLAAGNRSLFLSTDFTDRVCKDDTIRATFFARNLSEKPMDITGEYCLVHLENGKKQTILHDSFTSNKEALLAEWQKLPSGSYELQLSARDKDGRTVDYKQSIILFSYWDNRPVSKSDIWLYTRNTDFDDARPAQFCFGTSFKDAYVMVDMFSGNKRLKSSILQISDSIVRYEVPYLPEYGRQAEFLFTFIKDDVIYSKSVSLNKRLPSKELTMKWEVFRDKLLPGQQEEWKLTIKTPKGNAANAEMLATMYDASLDKIYPNRQLFKIDYPFPYYYYNWSGNYLGSVYYNCVFPMSYPIYQELVYDRFFLPSIDLQESGTLRFSAPIIRATVAEGDIIKSQEKLSRTKVTVSIADVKGNDEEHSQDLAVFEQARIGSGTQKKVLNTTHENEHIDNSALRSNFSETAFFYPQLRTNEKGEIAFSFTMPESLTRWSFRGYAHTKDMLTGTLEGSAVTAKDFMLSPNLPRFVRVGDQTSIAASISNLTGKEIRGITRFELFDPMSDKIISTQKQAFIVDAGKTVSVKFDFDITDRYALLGVRLIADGGSFSDGEQHILPVLSNKEYITETVTLPIRGEETRTFALDSLFNRNSNTATNRRLTVEFTSNPAWYAVQALPAMNLPQNDNAISWATAYYANSLASFIVNSQPRIKTVFDSWRATGDSKETFMSRLQKNQDVKNILIEETPWLSEATSETEQMARIATLFDLNNLSNNNIATLTKLKELQNANGTWSWCKGMNGSRSTTAYITELLIRLPLLTGQPNADEAQQMLRTSWEYLHKEALQEYKDALKAKKEGANTYSISSSVMNYLYLIAFSGEKVPVANAEAYRYFLDLVGKNLKDSSIRFKAQAALILQKSGRNADAKDFIASIKEHLVTTPERGAYFAFYETPYLWGMLPVSIHVEAMEALRLTEGNTPLLEDMKLWLLKQKQTTNWNSAVADADAVYVLLCQGSNLLANPGDVSIKLGNKVIETASPIAKATAGLGYVKEVFGEDSSVIRAKSITVTKRDAGIAWGAVYAQYLEDISAVKQHGGELNVEKKLYIQINLPDGRKELQPLTPSTKLNVGDKVVSRLTIRLDRAMDFVQLKDQRGACFEPESTLSGYQWDNGLGYYVEVKDASTNFFFDHLGKGVWVLEYSYRVARSGQYENGLATLQCAYAPEYATHSASGKVVVK